MKWYKKQLDAIKKETKHEHTPEEAPAVSKNPMASKKSASQLFKQRSGGVKPTTVPNPVAMRNVNRPKTDSK